MGTGHGKVSPALLRALLRGWLLAAAGWGCLFLAIGLQMAQALSQSPLEAFRALAPNWLAWTLLTPLIFRAVARWPIERGRWLVAAGHVAGCLAVILVLESLKPIIEPRRMQGEPDKPPPPLESRGLLGLLLAGPNLPLYLAILGAAHASFFYRRGRERELRSVELTASLAEARLQALRMQLQPHFLFNSLNALGSLMHEDLERADEMLVAVSEFLRLTLKDSAQQEVTLERELEYVRLFLAIEKVRFGERLEFSIDRSADLNHALVPTLLLQPIVENAVRHGIEPRRDSGSITVGVRAVGASLRLVVADDGKGMADSPAVGVGLSNTLARLRELYGERASLRMTARDGTVVEIRLPLRFAT